MNLHPRTNGSPTVLARFSDGPFDRIGIDTPGENATAAADDATIAPLANGSRSIGRDPDDFVGTPTGILRNPYR